MLHQEILVLLLLKRVRFTDLDIYILFPNEKISEVQQRQMTTSGAANVHTLAIDGDFDDCQRYVKKLFLNQINLKN